MKRLLLFAFILGLCSEALARQRISGYCQQGGVTLTVSGIGTITRKVQASYPGCTVAIYYTGTTNLATTYANDSGTSKTNNSASDSTTGYWFYYVDNGRWDVRFSGGGITTPFTIADIATLDPGAITSYSIGGIHFAEQYNFTPRLPGGTLTAATPATVDLGSVGGCPKGVAGTDTNHYLYVSGGTGTAENVLITGGTCTSGSLTGNVQFTPANTHSGNWTIQSASGGIYEAYADFSTSGGTVIANANVSLPSLTATIVMKSGKPLLLDCVGHRITLSHTTGAGISFEGDAGDLRTPYKIQNCEFTYSGAGTSLTGVQLKNTTYTSMSNSRLFGFNTTGTTALVLDNAQEGKLDEVYIFQNKNGLTLQNSANANEFHVHLQENSGYALQILSGSSSAWFEDSTIQGNTGTYAVQVVAASINQSNIRFKHCHFEDNGDTTANSADLYFNTSGGQFIVNTTVEDSIFSAGTNGASGAVYKFSATGTPGTFLTRKGNYYTGYTTFISNPIAGNVTSINENNTFGTDSADVTINGNGMSGLVKATAFVGSSANPSTTGVFRLAKGDSIKIRNEVNGADINVVYKQANDILSFGGLTGSTGIVAHKIGCDADCSFQMSTAGGTATDHNFVDVFTVAPNCTVTPLADPGSGIRYWVTITTTKLTLNTSSATTLAWVVNCLGAP